MPAQKEICSMDAEAIAQAVKTKKLSAREVTDAFIDRMERLEPSIHAFCTPTIDMARKRAREIEHAVMAGDDLGPLAGVPLGVKDLIAAAGIKMASGSFAYEHFVPETDDIVVERVKAAGAVILGKTNVPEFGYSGASHNPVFETTRNPWNPERTTGGSSAGSGAAVASGMCPFALGSDGGGSIRIPAAFCGIYGIKPSMGRVPLYPGCRDERFPGVSSWETIEHLGPMSRSVGDAALMLAVIAGPDDRDRHSIPAGDVDWLAAAAAKELRGLRIAYSPDWGYAAVDPEIRRVVGDAVRVFETELGCTVEEAHPGFEDPYGAFWGIVALDTDLKGMREMVAKFGPRMSPHLVDFIMRPWTAEDLTTAAMQRKHVANKMWQFMRRFDLLLTPTTAVPPFPLLCQGPEKIDGKIATPFQWIAFTSPMNMTGQPAASIPAGYTSDGLPVGLQIVGRHLDDQLVLRASAAFEQIRPWRKHEPAIVKRLP